MDKMDKSRIDKISYKPNLQPTRKYYSEGTFRIPEDVSDLSEEGLTNSKNDILDKLTNIFDLLDFIPHAIQGNMKDMIMDTIIILEDLENDFSNMFYPDVVIKEDPDLKPEYPGDKDKEDPDTIVPLPEEFDPDEGEIDDWEDDYFDDSYYDDKDDFTDGSDDGDDETGDNYNDDYDFELEDYDPDIKIELEIQEEDPDRHLKEHDLHLTQILDKYATKMNGIMSDYITRNIYTLDIGSDQSLKYLLREYRASTADISNPDLKHLSDVIIKEQILNSQNYRLFNKLFNKKQMEKHLRHCKIAAMQKKRYYNINYNTKGDYSGLIKNHNLDEQRHVASDSYDSAFLNCYRFFNSQTEFLKDMLTRTTKEITSKSVLVKEEGIELKTNVDYFVEEHNAALGKIAEKREVREAKLKQRKKEREEKHKKQKALEDELAKKEFERRGINDDEEINLGDTTDPTNPDEVTDENAPEESLPEEQI